MLNLNIGADAHHLRSEHVEGVEKIAPSWCGIYRGKQGRARALNLRRGEYANN
jgi:hypothetical protein